jgi:hypothetical protein
MMRTSTRKFNCGGKEWKSLLLAATCTLAVPAFLPAQSNITYNFKQTIGQGSVVGTVVTDGNTGVLAQSDLLSWNLQLNGPGATYNLTSAGSQSLTQVAGSDLTATKQGLYFNFSGTDNGYLLVQASSPGIYSGYHYVCENTTTWPCEKGASVAPLDVFTNNSSFQDVSESGVQELALAGPSSTALYNSVQTLAQARTAQALVNQLQSQTLVGLNEQVSCGNCGGGSMSFGSANFSAHGRYSLSPEWTLLGGSDLGQYEQQGANVNLSTGLAAAIQYDPVKFGSSRPYAEAGVSASYQRIHYTRSYDNGSGTSTGAGKTHGFDISAYGEAGWVARITPRDEAAAYLSYSRLWQIVSGYTEPASSNNPFNAAIPAGTDVMDVAGINAQFTHLFGRRVEANANGGAEWAFNTQSGLSATIGDVAVAPSQPDFVYYQAGGRMGIRLKSRLTADLFVNSVLATHGIPSSAHGGFGLRWAFK